MKKSFFFLAGLLLLSACGEQQAQQAETEYKTLVVSLSDRTLNTEYTAKLRGRQYVEIRPQVSGLSTEIRINEGDAVHKGQILFVIDQVPYKAALETAIANVKSAEAQLATAKLTADSKEQLYKENIVSDFDLQSARNTLAAAEAALAQASAQEINARNNLSYTEVKSPVDGVASMIQYRVGALVSSSITEPLVTVADTEQMHAYLSLSEVDILDLIQQYGSLDAAIAQMPDVSLKMINGADYPHKGRIDASSATVEESTGKLRLRATFANPEGLLHNGGSGQVTIPTTRRGCIIIPKTATYELQNRIFVYKVVDGKTQSTPITVYKLDNGTEYIVESGLAEGDEIIAEGAGLLRDGIEVKSQTNKE